MGEVRRTIHHPCLTWIVEEMVAPQSSEHFNHESWWALRTFEPVMGSWWRQDVPDLVLSGYLDRADTDRGGYKWRLLVDGDLGDIQPGYETSVTLFGNTAVGPMTLHHAAPTGWRFEGDSSGKKTMSRWEALVLMAGDHLPLDHLYRHASFGIPHAVDWLGPSTLNAYVSPQPLPAGPGPDGLVTMSSASLPNGLQLHAHLVRSESFAPLGRQRRHEWRGLYSLTSESGFTLQQGLDVAYALSQLQSLAFGTYLESYEFRLAPHGSDPHQSIEVVGPHQPGGQAWRGLGPFFDTSEVDYSSLIAAWLVLRERVPLVDTLIAPQHGADASVQVMLLAQCSALEALAQHYWERPGLSESDRQILDALEHGGINSKRRSMVENQLRQRRWPLEHKLVTAAALAGDHSSQRLLGSIPDWAHLVMRLRNSLAHGLQLPAGLGQNVEFVVEAQRSVAAVLQLAVLNHLGYTNRLGSQTGELLWFESGTVASHVDSDFFDELKHLATRSSQWEQWRRQLDGHVGTPPE